jgi:hypothetical protein
MIRPDLHLHFKSLEGDFSVRRSSIGGKELASAGENGRTLK